jgi:hypothetical protein
MEPTEESLRFNKQQLQAQWMKERQILQDAAAKMVPKNELSKVLGPTLSAHKARYDQQVRDLDEQWKLMVQERHTKEGRTATETAPRKVGLTDAGTLKKTIETRAGEIAADPKLRENSVLENLKTPADLKPLHDLAAQIYRQNNSVMQPEDAMDIAVQATTINPKGKGHNGETGPNALEFKAQRDPRGLKLEMRGGQEIIVDKPTADAIQKLLAKNWDAHTKAKTAADAKAAEDAKRGKDIWSRAGRAAIDLAPKMPPGAGPLPFPNFMK